MKTKVEQTLEIYTLQEILELNEVTEEDTLLFLIEQKFIQLPNPKPLDFNEE